MYPALSEHRVGGGGQLTVAIGSREQALNQLKAAAVTLAIAVGGGLATGLLLRAVGRWQHLDEAVHKGMICKSSGVEVDPPFEQAKRCYDDHMLFLVNEDDDDDDDGKDDDASCHEAEYTASYTPLQG